MMGIAATALILSPERLRLGREAVVDHFAIIGQANAYPDIFETDEQRDVIIGDHAVVGCYALLFEGARLAERVHIEPRGLVGSRTVVGSGSRLVYGAQVHDDVVIGEGTFIGGFVADHCRVGSRCYLFGSLVHEFRKPGQHDWDTTDEVGPTIGDGVIIGWGAIIIGPVRIGSGARVKPGAVVRQHVADNEVYG
jgi:acetyltransferase-like isoleucine patch superfamily enzyme